MITQEYKQLNKELFNRDRNYGTSGHVWADLVKKHCDTPRSILDYGCGRRTLEQELGFPIQNYDPCIEGYDEPPDPADFVVCTDVLEHIEPEQLDAVLDDLKRVVRKKALFVIATRPAGKTLADGRNAHLLIKSAPWWLSQLWPRFFIFQFTNVGEAIIIVAFAK